MIAGHYVIPEVIKVTCIFLFITSTVNSLYAVHGRACKILKQISLLLFLHKVSLFFHGKLYRGNRALKVDARRFGAFDSPNCPPLATVEAGIEGTWFCLTL